MTRENISKIFDKIVADVLNDTNIARIAEEYRLEYSTLSKDDLNITFNI